MSSQSQTGFALIIDEPKRMPRLHERQPERGKSERIAFPYEDAAVSFDGIRLPAEAGFSKLHCCNTPSSGIGFIFPSNRVGQQVMSRLRRPHGPFIAISSKMAFWFPGSGDADYPSVVGYKFVEELATAIPRSQPDAAL